MGIITASVGRGGINRPDDVRVVQDLLNQSSCAPDPALIVDGKVGSKTIATIEAFQKKVVRMRRPDGRVDPRAKTFKLLSEDSATKSIDTLEQPAATGETLVETLAAAAPVAAPATLFPAVRAAARLIEADFERAAQFLDCEIACVRAVTTVEARGGGFFASGRPKILFEAHIFSKRTKRKYDATHPDISSPKWNRKLYKGGEKEYERLEKAIGLDRSAALESASWGLFQIMGFNFQKAGFDSVDSYVEAMFESEGRQLDAFVNFIKGTRLDGHLRAKRWANFAQAYNGPAYAENKYDTKLQAAYEKYLPKG